MDDRLSTPELTDQRYRCPGEGYDIDRAAHLGRLATFYPACRGCVHRGDLQGLAPEQVRQWGEILARVDDAPRFSAEAFEGQSINSLGPDLVARLAMALGITLVRDQKGRAVAPAVLVGGDGHFTTSELTSTACEALALAGCRAIESGSVTAAALAAATDQRQSDAALWIGNATGQAHTIALRLWGRAGQPWSSPGRLDKLRETFAGKLDRPRRKGGRIERVNVDDLYVAPLAPMFHALRPLRIVIDTTCAPLLRYLRHLSASAACELLPLGETCGAAVTFAGERTTFVDRRLAAISRPVISGQAHFGLWIDGCGESCRLVDERGAAVESARLCRLLAEYVCRQKQGAMVLLEPDGVDRLRGALASRGAQFARGAATREGMWQAMESTAAVFAGEANGTFWFSGPPPAPDALLVTALLLTIMSESDRPTSEVLDAA